MADIFISYARPDRDRIEKLAAVLERESYSVWWDRHIDGGSEFSKDIERELDTAQAVIVAWTKDAIDSRWVKDEAGLAAEAGKLVSISIDGSAPPIGFKQFHAIDFTGDQKLALADLVRSVASKIGATNSQSASATPSNLTSPTGATPKSPFKDPKIFGGALALIAIAAIIMLTMRSAEKPAMPEMPEKSKSLASVNNHSTPATATVTDNNIVAVLPFANRSANADDAFFADGMHDDLLTKLSKVSALQVISRTSVMRFRDTEQPIPEIASTLGAAVVMEGAVQRAGNRVRINVQLIDGATDQHLWAEIYDREMTAENIFDIQEEITRAIAEALHTVLSGDDEATLSARPTDNDAAYEAYLRGIADATDLFTVPRIDREGSIAEFNEAITLDPKFSAAYARKSYQQLAIYWLLGGGEVMRSAAKKSLDQAIAIAPDDIETLFALGYYQYWGELDYEAADKTFDELLARAPGHVRTLAGKAFTQRRRGNYVGALEGLQSAARLSPLDITNWIEIVDTAPFAGEWGFAEVALARAAEISPRDPAVALYGFYHSKRLGDVERAFREARRLVDNAPARLYSARLESARLLRDRQKIEAALANWPQSRRSVVSFPEYYDLSKAAALYELGDIDAADALLAKIKASVDARADPYPAGWAANAFVYPVELPGLTGDLEEVERLVADYEREKPNDVWGNRQRDQTIAIAFGYAGDADRAMDYIERSCEAMGDWCYRYFRPYQAFENIYEYPRWIALERRYEAWCAENKCMD
ncbi:MAG: TIR domain-containing protein [Marinicaulis sp.]|nr:TIR domain-containing protein [Marinicaulis sp.]